MPSPTPAPMTPTPATQAYPAPSSSSSHPENPDNNKNNDDDPQSPPLQPPSLTSAGPRATALNRIFSEALSHSLRTCTYANFAACFPTPAVCEPDALRELWRMFGRELEERCRASYDAILTSRAVIPSLNELDRLIADARKRKEHHTHGQGQNGNNANSTQIPPHTLPPQTLYTAHLRPFLHAQSTTLHDRAASLHERNDTLASRIHEQRDEMDMLVRKLEDVVGDLEGAAGLVDGSRGTTAGANAGAGAGSGNGETMETTESMQINMIGRNEIRELEGW